MDEDKRPQEQGPLPRSREAVDWWLRKWGRHVVADGQEPLTRQDVERLIEANGGTAEGLDLSMRDMKGAKLYKVNLHSADLAGCDLQGTYLGRAILQNANLVDANLGGARLVSADLRKANLFGADLQGADLEGANLQDARLAEVRISPATNLEGVRWGKDDKDFISVLERDGYYEAAIALYRRLKRWYEEAGMLSIAGEFHYREREATRKLQWHRLRNELKGLKHSLTTAWRRLRGQESSTLKE